MTDREIRRISGTGDLEDAFDIRRAVFMNEQGVTATEEFDGNDESAVHFVVYRGQRPVGTARLRFPENGVAKIERVAVRKPARGRGIGRTLIEALEEEANAHDCSRILLHAQTDVEEFYEKLGYETVSGVFIEDGIPHVKMTRELP